MTHGIIDSDDVCINYGDSGYAIMMEFNPLFIMVDSINNQIYQHPACVLTLNSARKS